MSKTRSVCVMSYFSETIVLVLRFHFLLVAFSIVTFYLELIERGIAGEGKWFEFILSLRGACWVRLYLLIETTQLWFDHQTIVFKLNL